MSSGQILVAEHRGTYVIRLLGDVRLTLCLSFDQFIDSMFADENALDAVLFDLREAHGIDSTTLGLMAKISIGARSRGLANPVAITSSPSIRRLLVSMGFEDIFDIVSDAKLPFAEGEPAAAPLSEDFSDEAEVRARVLEAHQILMDLNQPNKIKFHELVETLRNKS
jgi:anti-anti-sigma regulatory factor